MTRITLATILLTLTAAAWAGDGRQACMADYRKFCSAVQPGQGRVKACLQSHRAQLSEPCKAFLDSKNEKGKS